MKNRILLIILILAFVSPVFVMGSESTNTAPKSVKKERNYIRKGNDLYNEKRFAEAEVEYKKALQENAQSEVAMYNLASSLIRQSGSADPNSQNNPMQEATKLLNEVAKSASDINLQAKAFYNMGNLAFNQQQYDQSIAHYKNSLRRNPNDEQARQNLRMAQLKKKEQDQQNKDNKQDQDKKDQDKKDQDKKDQKDQNKDQQDKNKDKQDQDKKQDQDQNKPEDKEQKPQQQSGGISEDNAEQILKAMQNEEKATQQKINAARMKEEENQRRRTKNQW